MLADVQVGQAISHNYKYKYKYKIDIQSSSREYGIKE